MDEITNRPIVDTTLVLNDRELCVIDVRPIVGDVLTVPFVVFGLPHYRVFIVDMVEDNFAYLIPFEPKVIGE